MSGTNYSQNIDGAPALMRHKMGARYGLNDTDIATTIDLNPFPLIYTGVWTPEWAKGQEIRTYAAITDARDEDGVRICRTFNQCVEYLNQHPNGEKLLDRPAHARNVTYGRAMRARILDLKPGEFTKQMIPPLVLVRGKEYPGEEFSDAKITHPNNMYDLRHRGDFAKANNNGVDSRFEMKAVRAEDRYSWYVSSTKNREGWPHVCVTEFTNGFAGWSGSDDGDSFLRPFVAEIPKP